MPAASVPALPARHGRAFRWVRRVLVGIAGFLFLSVLALSAVLHDLDRPWVKRRVQALAREQAGADIEYGTTRVRLLSGLRIGDLVVRSPPGYRAVAPELLRVGSVEVGWSLAALLGKGHRLSRLTLRGVEVTVVRDGDGKTSLAALAGAGPPGPPTRPSLLATELLGQAPPVARVAVEQAALTLISRSGDRTAERWHLSGLSLSAEVERGRLRVQAGTEAAPLHLTAARERVGLRDEEAALRLWLETTATPAEAALTADLQVARQSFAPSIAVTRLLYLEARAHFKPQMGTTEVTLSHRELDGAGVGDATVELSDTPGALPLLRRVVGIISPFRLRQVLPAVPVPVSAGMATLAYSIGPLAVDGSLSGNLGAQLDELDIHGKRGWQLRVQKARLDARLSGLRPDSHDPLRSRGMVRVDVALDQVELSEPSLPGGAITHGHMAGTLDLDAGAPSLRLHATADTPWGPEASLKLTLGLDRARRAVSYDLDAHLSCLAPLRPLLAPLRAARGFDLSKLSLGLGGRGTLTGLIASRPSLNTLGVNGYLELHAKGFRFEDGDRAIWTPEVSWRGDLRTEGVRRRLHGELRLDALHVALGDHQIDVTGIHDSLDVTSVSHPARLMGELSHHLTLGTLRQDLLPGYPLGGVSLSLRASRGGDGVLRIPLLRLDNPQGGTVLSVQGGLELGEEHRGLSLRGTLSQDLSRPWRLPREYAGKGALSVSLQVDSNNLSLFRTLGAVRVTNGNLRLPRLGVAVEGFDGEVPVAADLVLGRKGLHLLHDAAANAYSELRFADQHPLISRPSFISAARVTTPFGAVTSLAGNLKIENNLVALSQLEMGLAGGRLGGQCLLDLGEKDASVRISVRASGIRAGRGERFDGNAAVVLSPRERDIEGRAEVLRIGRHHLLDVLDFYDPHRADPAINRVRHALRFGYPDRVRLVFDHGFASAHITFGGAASLVHVGELRGIPLGPIIDKAISQANFREDEDEP